MNLIGVFFFDKSILPESPRWLISKQRYDEAELLLHRIAERNRRQFDANKYKKFVTEDKKVIKAE